MIRRLVALSFLFTAVAVAAGAGTTSAAFGEEAEASVQQEGWAAQRNDPSQPVEDELGGNLGPVPVDPVAPATVPPGSLPVGLAAGEPEWKSFLQFDLSAVPFDATIDSFVITLTEVEPGESLTGVEVCAINDLWAEGANQKWSNAPEHDCAFSADVVGPADDGTWTADLTNVARAWQDVIIPNNGIVLLPKSAANLPSGTPTPEEANWRVQFAGVTLEGAPTAQVEYTVTESPSPPPPPPPAAAPPADSGQAGGADTGTSSQPFFGNAPSFEPQAGPAFTPPVAGDEGALAPEVAPDAGQQPVPETVAAPAVAGDAETPAYVWALIPLFLLGMLMLGRSLTDTTPVAVTRREGATTRLIRNRRGPAADALAPSEPSFQV
ncbi:MAG: DNRLRE domain-containing protein [Actinobacteria bacterium]|nr:DNRLRE domain-containing protein [Actinomycetota bacterium]